MDDIRCCEVLGCKKTSEDTSINYCSGADMYLCSRHRSQFFSNGCILERTIRDNNEIDIHKDYAEIILYDKNNKEKDRAIIDLEDVEKCKGYRWGLNGKYIVTKIANKEVRLDKYIMECNNKKCIIKHINGYLDNRKEYLNVKISSIEETTKQSFIKHCNVEGCENDSSNSKVFYCKEYEMFLCLKHNAQMRRHGKILSRTKKDGNEIVLHDDYAEIILYDKKGQEACRTKIDFDDVEKCRLYKWCFDGNYVKTQANGQKLYLHRYIMDCFDSDYIVDHLNCIEFDENLKKDKLDNRKQYLEVKLERENGKGISVSKSKVIGVSRLRNKYESYIHVNGRKVNLGLYDKMSDAIKQRLKAEKKYDFTTQKYLWEKYDICDKTDLSDIPELYVNKIDLDKVSIRFANRRANKKGAIGNLTLEEYIQIQELFKSAKGEYECAYCNTILNNNNEALEHIVSINNKGATKIGNVLPSCRRCNSNKDKQKFERWYRLKPFFSESKFKMITDYRNNPKKYISNDVVYIELILSRSSNKYFKAIDKNLNTYITDNKDKFANKFGICLETINRGLRGDKTKKFEFSYPSREELTVYLKSRGYDVRNLPKIYSKIYHRE
ncbi:hypothetical protein SAMN02745163_01307 [Clostridium cavendishii DSM 21758]|uniref:HNH nuclease domain-containing protein n=1 Tax=Clostridium cavendishii DSM 21758 TaxID=1121302 RepID=A0A1M6GJK3_9CLOT|nr:hypothetical protein [Clostridium cavendishii]SHJ10155.1 hypothetical protein SAMN02745163_01307 [Clostridium cavendishii DSM 21758]